MTPWSCARLQGIGDLARDLERLFHRESPFAHEPRAQRLAVDVRHDEVQRARGLAGIVEREDERMTKVRQHADLTMEPLHVHRQVATQDLDRHRAIVS